MEGAIVPRAEDEFPEYAQQKKRRGRATSIVWEHFDKLKDEVDDVWKTQCKHCKQIYSSAQKNGTSHLKRHMDRCPIIKASGWTLPTMSTLAVSDGPMGYEPSIKRSRSISKVWEDFEKLKAERDDILKARCIHCKQILSGVSKHGTSHLKRHLERCPKRRNHDVRQLLLSNEVRSIKQLLSSNETLTDGSIPLKKFAVDQNEILKAISTFILCGKHPVTVVEEFGFRHLMSIICPEFENVNVHAIRREIAASYLKERNIVKELLGRVPGRICLTCENLTSEYSKDEFMCLTAHFIDNDWKLVKKIICFKALVLLKGMLIADEIALCLNLWNIDTKIFSITSDNASDDDGMVHSLKGCLLAKKDLLIGGTFFEVQCCCQILNLIVKASLNLVDDVADKICSGVEHIRKVTSRKNNFYLIAAKDFQLDTKKRLRPDVRFRWNTTYMMLERALYYKNMLQSWGEQDSSFMCYNLSDEEWEKVAIIQKFLAVFYDVECTFSNTKYPTTSNLYFRALWKIHMHLLKTVRGPSTFMASMVADMQEKFEKYWTKNKLILSCAAVLDPRYKVKFVEFCYTKIHCDKAEEFVNTTVRTLYSLFDEYKLNSATSSSFAQTSAVPSIAEQENGEGDEFEDYEQFLSRKSRPQDEKSQLDLYLEEPGHELNSDINVLEYWNNSSMRYPELAMMARDILTIPISSVSPEAIFSIGKKVLHPGQSSLNPKMIQALVCLSDWTCPALDKSSGASLSIIHENGDPSASDEDNDYNDWDIEGDTFS